MYVAKYLVLIAARKKNEGHERLDIDLALWGTRVPNLSLEPGCYDHCRAGTRLCTPQRIYPAKHKKLVEVIGIYDAGWRSFVVVVHKIIRHNINKNKNYEEIVVFVHFFLY